MQNIAVQTKTSGVKSSTSETSSPIKRKKDQSEFVDPFMQIIMTILEQSQDPISQQTSNPANAAITASAIDDDNRESPLGYFSKASNACDRSGSLSISNHSL